MIAPGGCNRSSCEHKFHICVGMQDKKKSVFHVAYSSPRKHTGSINLSLNSYISSELFFLIYFSNVAELGGVNATKLFGKYSWKSAATFLREKENLTHCSRLHKRCFKEYSDPWPSGLNPMFKANKTLPLERRHPGSKSDFDDKQHPSIIWHLFLVGVTGAAGVVPSSDWERSRGILTFRPDVTLTGNSRNIPKPFMFQNNNNNNNKLNLIMNHSLYYICKQYWQSTPQQTPLTRRKKEKNKRMWRAREETDRYCRPLFFTLWNSDVLPGDWFGRGEMDGNKMGGKNMKHARGEHRLGFRVDDSSFLSRWDEDVCPLTRTVYYPLSASITIKSHVR